MRDQSFGCKVFRHYCLPLGPRMRFGNHCQNWVAKNSLRMNAPVLAMKLIDNRNINLPLEQRMHRVRSGVQDDAQVARGTLLLVLLENFRQPVVAGIALCRESKDDSLRFCFRPHAFFRLQHRRENLVRRSVQSNATGCGSHTPPQAIEKPDAQAVFQARKPMTQGGLTEMQAHGRAAQRSLFAYCRDEAQISKLE